MSNVPQITRFVDSNVSTSPKERVIGRPRSALRSGHGRVRCLGHAVDTLTPRMRRRDFRSVVDKLKVMGVIEAVLELE